VQRQVGLHRADDGQIIDCNVTGMNLSGLSAKNTVWPYTQWWLAARIDPALLKYLETNYPYRARDMDAVVVPPVIAPTNAKASQGAVPPATPECLREFYSPLNFIENGRRRVSP